MPLLRRPPARWRKPKSACSGLSAHAAQSIACRPSMPELPEVETVMRGLQARLRGPRDPRAPRSIGRTCAGRCRPAWPTRLTGARVIGFRRRAKYILMRLDGGDSVLLHLGMSGRMLHPAARRQRAGRCTSTWRWRPTTAGGSRFVDPRRFGSIDLVPTARRGRAPAAGRAGPGAARRRRSRRRCLSAALAGRRTPIKAALLDQRIVAGLGNIYVCEALFRARIAPHRAWPAPVRAPRGWCRRSRRR